MVEERSFISTESMPSLMGTIMIEVQDISLQRCFLNHCSTKSGVFLIQNCINTNIYCKFTNMLCHTLFLSYLFVLMYKPFPDHFLVSLGFCRVGSLNDKLKLTQHVKANYNAFFLSCFHFPWVLGSLIPRSLCWPDFSWSRYQNGNSLWSSNFTFLSFSKIVILVFSWGNLYVSL